MIHYFSLNRYIMANPPQMGKWAPSSYGRRPIRCGLRRSYGEVEKLPVTKDAALFVTSASLFSALTVIKLRRKLS